MHSRSRYKLLDNQYVEENESFRRKNRFLTPVRFLRFGRNLQLQSSYTTTGKEFQC